MSAEVMFWLTDILPLNKHFTSANINPKKANIWNRKTVLISQNLTRFKTAINIYSLTLFASVVNTNMHGLYKILIL